MAISPIKGSPVTSVPARTLSTVTLNAVPQSTQRASGASKVDAIFAVAQTAPTANKNTDATPRGSLIDVLA